MLIDWFIFVKNLSEVNSKTCISNEDNAVKTPRAQDRRQIYIAKTPKRRWFRTQDVRLFHLIAREYGTVDEMRLVLSGKRVEICQTRLTFRSLNEKKAISVAMSTSVTENTPNTPR